MELDSHPPSTTMPLGPPLPLPSIPLTPSPSIARKSTFIHRPQNPTIRPSPSPPPGRSPFEEGCDGACSVREAERVWNVGGGGGIEEEGILVGKGEGDNRSLTETAHGSFDCLMPDDAEYLGKK